MTRSTAGNRFRTRKLSTKQSLAVVREHQIDSVDDDAQRSIPQIDTGVERQEEIEHHLQAAISASQAAVIGGKVAQIFIPTPDASKTVAQYDVYYPKRFSQPSSYIRFSSTVEDCSGTTYCMDSEDEVFLKKLNSTQRPPGASCSEDTFEEVMQHFESIVQAKQPFLITDVSQIMSYEEMEATFDESQSAVVKMFAQHIYPHWKEQRIKLGGRPIMPTLKFEQGQDKDDGDPYVCFRRREVRQARKTRRTDAQSTEKLKKLRQEMEMARVIVADVLSREKIRKESLMTDQKIFELRGTFKDFKRKFNLKDDEELLYNHKKKPTLQAPQVTVRLGGPAITRPGLDQRPPEAELTQLSEAQRKKVEKWRTTVESGQAKRAYSNVGMEDCTESPILDSIELIAPAQKEYRGVQTFFLPSPPPSVSPVGSPSPDDDHNEPFKHHTTFLTNSRSGKSRSIPGYRRRVGRGGRLFIDRRHLPLQCPRQIDPYVIDRYKYDKSDDDDELADILVESNSLGAIQYRARLLSPPADHLVHPHSTMRRQLTEGMNQSQAAPMTRT